MGCALAAEQANRLATEQTAIQLLADFVESAQAKAKGLAMQNGKGMKQSESDDFDPQQRHHSRWMMMRAMGQMPVLGHLAKSVVFDSPPQMSNIPNGAAVKPAQIARHDPNPVLFFFLLSPLSCDALTFGPGFPNPDHPYWIGVAVAKTQ